MINFMLQNLILYYPISFLLGLALLVLVYKKYYYDSKRSNRKNLPPSPRKLPIIGNLHQLGPSLHWSLQLLSQQYGKLMLLQLGNKPTLVVSSAEAAREILKTHDTIFANRPNSRVARRLVYDYKDVAFAPYGQHWRKMRSISVLHLLSKQKVQSFRNIREDEIALVIDNISSRSSSLSSSSSSSSHVVNLSEIILAFNIDVICRAAFGRKYDDDDNNNNNYNNNNNNNKNEVGDVNFHWLLKQAIELLGVNSLGDFIPCLSWVDRFNGLNDRVENVAQNLDQFLEKVIQEHQYRLSTQIDADAVCDGGKTVKTFVDTLLEYHNDNEDAFPIDYIKAITLNMFLAGTVTTYALVEWTMSELIRHPKIMKELQEKVRKNGVVEGHKRMISEDELEKVTYLKAVIMEAFRLHHPSPLLMYREASKDVKVNGFDIAAGTQVVINAWAIQRDPAYWEQPLEFRPHRFVNNNSNYKGQDDFQFIPFGGGRRMCPGISFAMVDAELVIANLINAFDWNLPDSGELDMTESVGMDIHRQHPLMLVPTPYSRD